MNHDDDPDNSVAANMAITPQRMRDMDCDQQGIEWSFFAPTTRASFRDQRILSYRNYRNKSIPHNTIDAHLHNPTTTSRFYTFSYTLSRHPFKCSEYHFQLRNLLYATDKQSCLYSCLDTVRVWDSAFKDSRGPVIKCPSHFRVSTISASAATECLKRIVLMGSFAGEICVKVLGEPDDSQQVEPRMAVVTTDPMGITNHVELKEDRNGVPIGIISSNDNAARLMNMDRLQITSEFDFPWAVNCASLSPDKRLICVSGDHTDSSIVSADSGDEAIQLTGHIDFSFACAWSPCGRYVATGNQDITTRVYDVRNASKALVVLPAVMGAVRSLRFTDDGAFLAAAEPCDFVHVYDFAGSLPSANAAAGSRSGTGPLGTDAFRSQVIDFFGEISGISFTPDGGDTLFVGVSDARYGSILEYERKRWAGEQFLSSVVL
ncbi:hypothetical protein BC830DRAFT_1140398 [Chytriomyces sp. MP71]|nr:hypothetical protein BC830DRAFT_1140398 [Chytriomyces sp. MP71]